MGVWAQNFIDTSSGYFSNDNYLWHIKADGTFNFVLVSSKDYYYTGNYSVSNGRIYLTNVVFTNDGYVGDKPNSDVGYVIEVNSEGKEQLVIEINDCFVNSGAWDRAN